MIIDSHCHLNHVKSKLSLVDVITNAKNNSINVMLNISTKKSEFDEIIEISKIYPEVYFTLGIHPHEAGEMNNDVTINIKKHANNNLKIVKFPKRKGDMVKVISDSSKLEKFINWKPHYNSLKKIVQTSLKWENKLKSYEKL